MPSVNSAIRAADALLPGEPAPEGQPDPRCQAIIDVSEYIESDPEPVWTFAAKWGCHEQADLRSAIATCLVEHLLEHHFSLVFPRARQLALQDRWFADTMLRCWDFGDSLDPDNASELRKLRAELLTRSHSGE